MADEPNWQPADAPPWAKQQAEPNWQPAEAPPWAKPAERSVLGRAGQAVSEQFGAGVEAGKKLLTPRTKEEAEEGYGVTGALKGLKETGLGLLSPLTMLTAPIAGAESLVSSAMGEAQRGTQRAIKQGVSTVSPEIGRKLREPQTSEEAYEAARPGVSAAMMALGPGSAAGKVPGVVGPASRLPARVAAKGPEAEAGRLLEHQIKKEGGDPEAVRQALQAPAEEIVPGSKPTTFQQTGDLGAGQVERGATTRHPAAFQERFGAQNTARLEAMENIQATGSPEEVASHLRDTLRTETAQADEGVRLAQQRAWEASQQVGGTYDATTYGNIFRRELQDAEAVTRAYERSLWEAVDPGGTLRANPQGIQELERRIYGVMPEGGAAEASLAPIERRITDIVQNYPPQGIPFSELRSLRSLVSTELRKELYTNGSTPTYARLSQLRGGIEESIVNSVGTEAAQRVRAASAATRQRAETFRAPGVKEATRREGTQGPYKVGEASVPDQFIKQGTKGYDTASNYLRAVGEPGLPEFADAVAAKARREVIGTNGEINPRKLEGFLRRHQDVLRAIDERDGGAFSQRLRNLGTAQDTLDAAIARQTQVAKQAGKDELRNIIGAVDDTDITRMIAGIFGREDPVGRMRELVSRLSGNDAALQGARRAVVEHLRTRLLSNMEAAATGKPIIKAEQFQNFVKHNEPALRQLMSPEQVQTMLDIARDIQQRSNRTVQTGIRGRSTTAQDIEGLRRQEESTLKAGAKQVGKVAGKGLLDTIASFIPGGPFAVRAGEAVLSGQMAKWKAKGINTIQELVDEAMLNPEVARELLGKTHTTKTTGTLGTRSGAGLYGGALSAEAGRKNDQKRVPRQAGGGVPAIGGTGGQHQGGGTPAGPRQVRTRPSQALQDGGTTGDQQADPSYETKLTPGEEHVFQSWKQKYAPQDSGEDYDFRGAFKAGAKPDPVTKHWVDTFKKPNHPTFSDQSQYAKDRPDLAGSWQGDTYIPPQPRAEGGEVAAQPQPGLRERHAAALQGTPASGPAFEKLQTRKPLPPMSREDIRRTLQQFGISGEAAGGFGERQLGERSDVDSRATGGSVDYETGERSPIHYDPGDETTFGARFGQWDKTLTGKSVPRDEEDLDTSIMAPGQRMIDPLGHRGTQSPTGPWFYTRGMQEGGTVSRDRWAALPSSRNIEDRRNEEPLSAGQLIAGNQAFMGHYPSPYTRAPRKPATVEARQTGGLVRSVLRRLTPEARMLEASRGEAPLRGLPQKPLPVGGEPFIPGPSADMREAARQYMGEKGLPYTPVQNYVPVDEPRARAIAKAYDVMPHRPADPEVQRAYEALAKETRDQYEVLKRSGVKFEPLPPNVPDPYGATPRLAVKDFLENKHLYYFPTEAGFGSEASGIVPKAGQKMLEPSGVKIAGKEVPFNDLFRVVHDVFGHIKEGVGFRAAGEENAWRSHGRMYSPEALPAMTAETRGQNSWVNYGPEAARNKGASGAETIYAPQKLGILPPWVIRSGRMTPLGVAGAAAAMEEGDRDEHGYADGGLIGGLGDESEAVQEAAERAALRQRRGVLGAETMEGRGRPGDKFVEDPGQKEEAGRRIFEAAVPQSPLDWGLLAATGPFRWPIKAGALALGAMMEPSEAEAGKLGVAGKIGRKITGAEVPAAGRSVTRSHNMPPEELAPYPQFAEEYPAVGPPVLKPKTKPKYAGETYEAKQLTPEAEAFQKERLRIQKRMDAEGYEPYFDPAKRTHVDPSNYPAANVDTLTLQPKKPQTLMEYQDVIHMPATRELLRAAYERGLNLGDAKNWYAMAQLEEAYTNELGPQAGRKAFLDEFAVPMSAMTSGNDPETNFLLAQYAEHLRKQGKALPEEGHQLPVTVGGRRGAVNIRDYNAMRERGGYRGLGANQPKMHNFTRNIIGDPSRATIDEQMATGMTEHIKDVDPKFADRARRQAFGLMEKPVHEEAAAVGVPPANYQDVAWAGFKNMPGKPLISTISDAIERTHRLTGMPREEIVRRGLIRKEIPIYGLTAAATPYLWGGFRPQEGGSNNPTPAGQLPL